MIEAIEGAVVAGQYEQVAHAYYNQRLHPTCNDLGRLSAALLSREFSGVCPPHGKLIEVGAGNAILPSFLPSYQDLKRLLIMDSSPTMLEYSRRFEEFGARLMIGEAQKTGLEDESCSLILSSLGDPYNTTAFWAECERILQPEGLVYFTTPAFEWCAAFRASHKMDVAEFLNDDGSILEVASLVVEPIEQIELIQRAGLACITTSHVGTHELGDEVAPKLRVIERSAPAVSLFVARKPRY